MDFREVGRAIGDRSDEALYGGIGLHDSAIDFRQALAAIGAMRLHLVMAPLHQPRYRVGFEQLIDDAAQDRLFPLNPLDRPPNVAGTLFAMTRAAGSADHDHRSAAGAKPAEQMPGAIVIAEGKHRASFGRILRGLP